MKKTPLALTLSAACWLSFASITPVMAQGGPDPNVQMIVFPIAKQGSQQFIVTPKGFHLAIPGKGIDKNAKEVVVYQDAEKNYWYINKHGEPTPVDPQVLQSVYAQAQQQANAANAAQMAGQYQGGPPPQQYTGQPPVQQTTIVEQPNNSGGGSGTGAALAGMAGVAGGMVAGAAMSGAWSNPSYYGVPYGTPLYHGEGGNNYYMNNGNKAYVNNQQYNKQVTANQYNNNKQAANTFNNKSGNSAFDQWNKQGQWKDKDQWSKGLQNASGKAAGRFGGAAEEGRHFGGGEDGHHFGGDGGRFGGGRRGGGRRR